MGGWICAVYRHDAEKVEQQRLTVERDLRVREAGKKSISLPVHIDMFCLDSVIIY